MIKQSEILETINMVEKEHFDIRTVTMGLSLFGCIRETADKTAAASVADEAKSEGTPGAPVDTAPTKPENGGE